jgi:hypothetical protein
VPAHERPFLAVRTGRQLGSTLAGAFSRWPGELEGSEHSGPVGEGRVDDVVVDAVA